LAPRWLQIAHRGLRVGMTEPLLDRAQIDARPQTPGRERRAEFMQPEILRFEIGTLCCSLEAVEEVEFGLASGRREYQSAVVICSDPPNLQTLHKFHGDGNLSLPLVLWAKSVLRLVPHGDRVPR
jgi:hypothetical protein